MKKKTATKKVEQFTVVPMTTQVRVHTGMSRAVKHQISLIARRNGITQALVVNSLLARATGIA